MKSIVLKTAAHLWALATPKTAQHTATCLRQDEQKRHINGPQHGLNAMNLSSAFGVIAEVARISAGLKSASQEKTRRVLMKLLKSGIIALPLIVTATAGLAADYEIFAEFMSVETGVNHYSVERLDHKNKKLHHCTAVLDAETKQLSGQCTERPGFPTAKGLNLLGGLSNRFGGVPVFGSWKIDPTTGKTEFCISGRPQCVEVTPQ